MGGNQRDTFSSRLHEQPTRAQLEYYRIPRFEERMRSIWEPLLSLNRSQAIVLFDINEAARLLENLLEYVSDVALLFHGSSAMEDARRKLARFVNFSG
jgi:hypothetical protein